MLLPGSQHHIRPAEGLLGTHLWRAGRRAELIAPFSHDADLPPTKGEERRKGRVEEPRLHTSETISPVLLLATGSLELGSPSKGTL